MNDPVDVLGIMEKYAPIRDFRSAEREMYYAYMGLAHQLTNEGKLGAALAFVARAQIIADHLGVEAYRTVGSEEEERLLLQIELSPDAERHMDEAKATLAASSRKSLRDTIKLELIIAIQGN